VVREKPAALKSKSSASTRARGSDDAKPLPAPSARKPVAKRAARPTSATVAGVTISHPDRVLYPEVGITKLDIARYYESIQDWVIPHMAGRPLTLVRCPQGREGPCFYQKHIGDHMPTSVRAIMIREKDGKEDQYLVLDNLTGLIGLVQLGVLEFHPWGCLEDDVEKPDRLVIDLDPGPGVTWPRIVAAARLVRERLENSNLASFVKTTGGKGLHVVIPLERRATWDQAKAFTKSIADAIVRDHPTEYTAIMTKSRRQNNIFIDYLRNGRGATAIAPYSTRARESAPVATPLTWEELSPKIQPSAFTVQTIPKRLAKLKRDPWQDFPKTRQSITASMLKNA
jgi:bifunctional non-homologous end joining protein LigD